MDDAHLGAVPLAGGDVTAAIVGLGVAREVEGATAPGDHVAGAHELEGVEADAVHGWVLRVGFSEGERSRGREVGLLVLRFGR